MLQYEVVGLLEPQVYSTKRVVVERPDAEHADCVVIDVEDLEFKTKVRLHSMNMVLVINLCKTLTSNTQIDFCIFFYIAKHFMGL